MSSTGNLPIKGTNLRDLQLITQSKTITKLVNLLFMYINDELARQEKLSDPK